jgi:predicted transcriptional regulator of viral defense system
MPIIKYKNLIQKITEKPVFGVSDLIHQNISQQYAKKILHELYKSKKIIRIERGKYTVLDDTLTVAAHITEPCYVSMWSALSIHKLTTQIPFSVEIVTTRKRFNRKIIFNNTPIIFYTAQPKMMYGYENIIWKENIRIPVAKPEKIIIDSLYFKTVSSEELVEIIEVVDKKLLRSYAKLTHNTYVIKNVERLLTC